MSKESVRLDLTTWLALISVIVTMAGAMSALIHLVYWTRAEAAVHVGHYESLKIEAKLKEEHHDELLTEMKGQLQEQRKILDVTSSNIVEIGRRSYARDKIRTPEEAANE